MKIICPYTKLNQVTEFALRTEHRYDVEFVNVSNSDYAYFNLVYKLWEEKETFVIIEHDIVPWPGALKKIYWCPRPLCIYLAPHGMGENSYSLGWGISKYSKKLIKDHPFHLHDSKLTREWHHLDGELVTRLIENGTQLHIHHPPVLHLNPNRFPKLNTITKNLT